ncbi:hypothetical protein [Vibrio mangrovi]|uniref:Outer membrane protein beta-barrel domain-containing protein n=1 Tax=Vibrio mangrovi TaxID=474394 RepID=A0A1Y6IXU7_9VIBR|nr:hypothetical protein [Vibrio mangrovi]MDW6004575.1 hypothetical protein [Vibrio mangrovi]SMS00863.1 hypothetical protein VIM7927_02134 [Vibrio mangrovi]
MLKQALSLTITGLAFIFAPLAQAANFNYNYLEVRVGGGPESVGSELSMNVTDNFHVLGHIDTQMEDDWDIAGGIGFNGPLTQFADAFGAILLHQIKRTDDQGGDSDTLVELNIGGRLWIGEQLEVYGKLGKLDDHSVIGFGARFHSSDQLSLNMGFENNGIWGPRTILGVRYEY